MAEITIMNSIPGDKTMKGQVKVLGGKAEEKKVIRSLLENIE